MSDFSLSASKNGVLYSNIKISRETCEYKKLKEAYYIKNVP